MALGAVLGRALVALLIELALKICSTEFALDYILLQTIALVLGALAQTEALGVLRGLALENLDALFQKRNTLKGAVVGDRIVFCDG